LAQTPIIAPPPAAAPPSGERAAILAWHFGWSAAVLAVLAALKVGFGDLSPALIGALALGASPALAALLLGWRDGSAPRGLLLAFWAATTAGAVGLTGGVSGPLAVWCLAPIAAAALLGPGRLMAAAATLSVLGAALAGLAQAAGLWPAAPTGPLGFCLGLFGLTALALAFAAGLALSRRQGAAQGAGREALEQLLVEQPHLILAVEPDGGVRSAFGFAPGGLSQDALLRDGLVEVCLAADRPRVRDAIAAARAQGRSEVIFPSRDGGGRVFALTLRSTPGGLLFGVLRDATDQHAREAALEAARADAEALNAGKSRFLANMSHELRTPLNTIMGFSDIMKARLFGPLGAKYGEYAELIHESGRHLLDLINDLLDMSKIEAERFQLHVEDLDAREPVSAALRLLRVQADDVGVSLRAVLPPGPLDIEADPRALKQIVLNLVSNALKFTPRTGQVTVTLAGHGETLELAVVDTGVGIAPEDLKRLGRPYEQAGDSGQRSQGTGLGLSLVRAFAELHGGEMIIESALGEGTSVTVRIPGLKSAEDMAVDERPSAQVIAFNPQR
jgi:cell cycle sensor histidine kinase DivJ